MSIFTEVRKDAYYDSVTLMLITNELKNISGVKEVIVGMGTPLNKELADNLGLLEGELKEITPNDFFIAASGSEYIQQENIIIKLNELLNRKKQSESTAKVKINSIGQANSFFNGKANLALISLPGVYAAEEARKALRNGMHVMIFSDNVSIEDEIDLKKTGREKGLLVMGPDCGTAIINHVPLCFANVVRRGDIGIVGASGTGTQEVTVQIDRLGGGISQVIGTGGRDLSAQVGGIMMLEGLKALEADPKTKVVVLVSKPPAPEVSKKILGEAAKAKKPVVVDFIGGDRQLIESYGAYSALSLEDAARKAVDLSKGVKATDFTGFTMPEEEINALAKSEAAKFRKKQKYIRALFTGGTLADEAMKILSPEGFEIRSNIPLKEELRLEDLNKSKEHTCIDLGDDVFTLGKPHPMIDLTSRIERLQSEAADEETAVILLDFVLGFGSHKDPAGEIAPYIKKVKADARGKGGHLAVIGYICGTEGDPQDYRVQEERLSDAGVILMPSNAQAARLAAVILKNIC